MIRRDPRPRRSVSAVVKRSLLVAGHATSISLEQEFWDELKDIAGERELSLAGLVTAIDAARQSANLSSAIRVFVLKCHQERRAAIHSAARLDLVER